MSSLTLITGGARSGKSEFAEKVASSLNKQIIYVATMVRPGVEAGGLSEDAELARRIEQHKKRRPATWQTIEVGKNLDKVINKLPPAPLVCLLDCVSAYVANVLTHDRRDLEELIKLLLQSLDERKDLDFVLVTSEVGWSVVPENVLARAYRDLLGELNMKLAKMSDTVWLSCAGLQIRLK